MPVMFRLQSICLFASLVWLLLGDRATAMRTDDMVSASEERSKEMPENQNHKESVSPRHKKLSKKHSAQTSANATHTTDMVPASRITEKDLKVVLGSTLSAIAHEANLLCPGETPLEPASFTVDCCSFAIREELHTHYQYKLGVTVDGQVFHARLVGPVGDFETLPAPEVEQIDPSPCYDYDPPLEDTYIIMDVHEEWLKTATDHISDRIQTACASSVPSGTEIGVRKVHYAQSRVVEGFFLRLVVSLDDDAHLLHEIEVFFNLERDAVQVYWPPVVDQEGLCSLLKRPSVDDAHMDEIAVLAADQDLGSRKEAVDIFYQRMNAGRAAAGHKAPVMEPHELASLLQRAEESSSFPPQFLLEQQIPKCFSKSVVKRQGTCGSCWLFSSLGAIGDRHCINNPDEMLDMFGSVKTLSVQQVLSCYHRNGCDGGHPIALFQSYFASKLWSTFEADYPYEARCFQSGHGVVEKDEDLGILGCLLWQLTPDNTKNKPCQCIDMRNRVRQQPQCNIPVSAAGRFGLQDFKKIPAPGFPKAPHRFASRWKLEEVNMMMMQSIFEGGSIISGFSVFADWAKFIFVTNGQQVYQWDGRSPKVGGHAVVIVGWGVAGRGIPYWRMRNSYGKSWGDGGYYMHIRGRNDCNVEGDVAVPFVGNRIRPAASNRIFGVGESDAGAEPAPVELSSEVAAVHKPSGGEVYVFTFTANCNGPCTPQHVALEVGTKDTRLDGAKCCCDYENYATPRCAWVPKEALKEPGLFSWLTGSGSCGTFNFGHGLADTVEVVDESANALCANRVYDGPETTNFVKLATEKTGDAQFQARLPLTKDIATGSRRKLRVRVNDAEHLYMVEVEERQAKMYLHRVFRLVGVQYYFAKQHEPVRIQSAWGEEWGTKTRFQLRVVATCSGPCQGSAFFTSRALERVLGAGATLQRERSESASTLLFSAELGALPPGVQTVQVTADFGPAGGKDSRSIDVKIPS